MAYVQHIAIFVQDLEASAGFYERVFGLERGSTVDPGPGFDMSVLNMADAKGHAITLIQPGDKANWREWKYETLGVNHIGFMVDSLDETLALLEQEEGVTGIERLTIDGQPVGKFRDINGTEIDVADSRYRIWDMVTEAVSST